MSHQCLTSSFRISDTTKASMCTELGSCGETGRSQMLHYKPLDDVARYLKLLVTKREQDDMETDTLNEWREVARVMDKLMFVVFFIIMVSVTSWLLLVVPNTQTGEEDLCTNMFHRMTAAKNASAHSPMAAASFGNVDQAVKQTTLNDTTDF